MKHTKTVETVVEDIYELMTTSKVSKGVDIDKAFKRFGDNVADVVFDSLFQDRGDTTRLRMSSVGKPDRQVWLNSKGTVREPLSAPTLIKFLYGHVLEEMLLLLTELSGHKVENQQRKVEVNGVKGSMDCTIDGTLIDVKSASSFGFKKFKDNTVEFDDPFGYVDQLKGYGHGLDVKEGGWLAMDKVNGQLALAMIDLTQGKAITDRIDHLKEVVNSTEMPEPCASPVADGKSGNMKLPTKCSYCDFKKTCYPELRTFLYSNGPKFLTEVWNVPRVIEVTENK
jgi:hypothetical protein